MSTLQPKHRKQKETISTDRWFPIPTTINHWCCRCGDRHVFKFRLSKGGSLEMKVTDCNTVYGRAVRLSQLKLESIIDKKLKELYEQ